MGIFTKHKPTTSKNYRSHAFAVEDAMHHERRKARVAALFGVTLEELSRMPYYASEDEILRMAEEYKRNGGEVQKPPFAN